MKQDENNKRDNIFFWFLYQLVSNIFTSNKYDNGL